MLATLPTEVIIRILGYADPQSRIRCRSVNHRLKYIVDDSDELQLQTECEIAGLICTTPRPGNHTVQTQLQAVRAYQKAWRTMNWKQSVHCSDFNTWVDDHTFRIRYSSDISPLILYTDGISPSTLDTERIPSSTRELQSKKCCLETPGYRIDAYAVDPGQDLLVTLERVPQRSSTQNFMGMLNVREGFDYRLHFLSLATGGPHRLSVSPVILKLNSIWHDEMMRLPIELSIGYRHVGVLLIRDLHGTANELWVVQWDTAVIKIHASQGLVPSWIAGLNNSWVRHLATSLSFLDSTSLILSFTSCHSRDPTGTELGVMRIKEGMQEGPLDELVSVTFELPRPRSPYRYQSIHASTSRHRPVLPLDSHRSNDCGLFCSAQKSRIFHYQLELARDFMWQPVAFHLIVTPMVLQHFHELYLRNAGDLKRKYDSGIKVEGHKWIIPWKAWGKETRLLHESATMHGRLSTSHNRLMTSRIARGPPAEPVAIVMGGSFTVPQPHEYCWTNVAMVLYEFSSRLALQRDMHVSSFEKANAMVVETEYHLDLETVEDGDSMWDEPIETGLPYRKSVINLKVPDAKVRESAIFNNGIGISRVVDSGTEWEIFCV